MGLPLDYNIIEAQVSVPGSAEFELVLERLTFERRASLKSTATHNPSYRASFQGIFFGFLTLRKMQSDGKKGDSNPNPWWLCECPGIGSIVGRLATYRGRFRSSKLETRPQG